METMTFAAPDETTDDYGNPVADWSDPETVAGPGCLFAPKASGEIGTDGVAVRTFGTVYAPGGTVVTSEYRITVRGLTFEVVGEPMLWANGYGRTGWEIQVAQVVGSDAVVGS